jgi:hypothetical protein
MKALLLMLSIALMILILTSNEVSTFTDYSSTGWTASTGRSWMSGHAINRIPINNGWQFICQGTTGICYEINGPWLTINDFYGEVTEDEGDPVQVTKN